MTSDNDLDQIVEQYLSRLNLALADVRPARRQQLIESIADHIREARSTLSADSEVALRDILDRVGQPEDIASEALGDQTESSAPQTTWIRRRLAIAVAAAVVVGLTLAVFLVVRNDNSTATTTATTTSTTISVPVTVPNVIGEPLASAQNQLAPERLLYEVVYVCSKIHLPPGVVTSQSPTAGTRTRTGSLVILTISTRQTCH